jgi:hypothetical protein
MGPSTLRWTSDGNHYLYRRIPQKQRQQYHFQNMHLNRISDGSQTAMGLFAKSNQATRNPGRFATNHESGNDAHANKSNRPNWEMFAIWGLLVVSFAAFFVAGYVVWDKCQNR